MEINGVAFEGIFLKTLNGKVQRDTILIPKSHGLIRQLSNDKVALEKVKSFNRWSQKMQKQWGLGKTGTLKKIERLSIVNSTPREFNLRTVAHHHGAVPTLPIGELEKNKHTYHVSILPTLLELPTRNPDEDKREILMSYDRYLPHLFEAYYEQIGFYLRAIFFGADEKHIIKYAHRIRSILVGSIRRKIGDIQSDRLGKNQPLADAMRADWKREIQIAEAVDAFGHLITNYLYSFFCIKSDTAKYEERLSKIVSTEDVMEEDPVSFLRECVTHISRSKNNDVFVTSISKLKTKWLIPFAEAAALIGEIKRSCQQGFFAPTIFVGYHFDIEGNEHAFDQLKLAVKEHWPHVQLLRGRHLARNIRWSLLGRIWITDAYLFLIPPSFVRKDGTKKPLNRKEDWLLLEFVYTMLIGKQCLTMKPKALNSSVLDEFKEHLNGYSPEHEIPQIRKSQWETNLAKAKKEWLAVMRDHERLPSMNALEPNSLASFEEAILNPVHEKLVGLFFQAAYWYLEPDSLLLLQILLSQFPAGNGKLARKTLRQMYNAKYPKNEFADAVNDLLNFELNLFGKLEPLVVEVDKREISLRLAEVVETLCRNFCCTQGQQRILGDVIDQMLSTRGNSR